MIRTLFATALALGAITGVAQAMPLTLLEASANGDVIAVAGGPRPGWHRGPYGGCLRNYAMCCARRVATISAPAALAAAMAGRS